jgi:hypothetical protein
MVEGGAYHVTYRRDAVEGRWRIARREHRTLSRVDYRPRRTYAAPRGRARYEGMRPIAVRLFLCSLVIRG